jgi:biopolymer transport protein ExbD
MSSNALSGEPSRARDVPLVVTDSGQYVLEGRHVDLADLRAKLRELKAGGRPINLHVVAGANPEYKFMAPAMQIVQEEGLGKVGLITTAPATPGSATSR